ncbi:MAG: hypothetical protein ACRD2U_13065 [Terriglobales bacterium]
MRLTNGSLLFALLSLSVVIVAQDNPRFTYPYLLHLQTMTFDDQACVLLRRDGRFHLEVEKGDHTKVFEGTLPGQKMGEVQQLINNAQLTELTQRQVAVPTGPIILDELHIDVFRGDHWQVLFFPDVSTRRPFDNFVEPLVQWLQALPKQPHRELSEDEGKNDCQLPKRLVLKRRENGLGKADSH